MGQENKKEQNIKALERALLIKENANLYVSILYRRIIEDLEKNYKDIPEEVRTTIGNEKLFEVAKEILVLFYNSEEDVRKELNKAKQNSGGNKTTKQNNKNKASSKGNTGKKR